MLAFAIATLIADPSSGTVVGTMHERGTPLDEPYAKAYCSGWHEGSVDPETGRFEIALPNARCRVTVGTTTASYSVHVDVPAGDTVELDLELVPRDHPKSTSWSLLGISWSNQLRYPAPQTVGIAGLNLGMMSQRMRVHGFDLGVISEIVDRGTGIQAGGYVRACGWTGIQAGFVAMAMEPEEENTTGCIFGATGAQIGLFHAEADVAYGVQVGGIMAKDFNLLGIQVAGILGRSRGALGGVQAAGVVAWSEWPLGVQVGGVTSIANWKLDGVQVAGVANVVREGPTNGVQLAPAVNVSQCLRGLQVGLINVAKRASGVQLGLLNVIGKRVLLGLNVGAKPCDE